MPSFPDHTPAPHPPASVRVQRPRHLQFAVFVAAIAWLFCAAAIASRASSGLALRFGLGTIQTLLQAIFLLFLLILGLALLRTIERRRAPFRLVLGLPQRSTSRGEWVLGTAIGWGLAVLAVLPMALGRVLNVHLWTTTQAFGTLLLTLLTLAVLTVALAVGVFGYAFQRLIEALGPVRATLLMVLFGSIYTGVAPGASSAGIVASALATLLLCLCWHRTHGLWLLWGLCFAWAASTGILFGLPVAGDTTFSSVVDTRATGSAWLTGGSFGPLAGLVSIVLLLAVIPILVKATSDYAWAYTHPPLIPAGYEVTPAPPAAHIEMEQQATAVSPASLVQILPATSATPAGTLHPAASRAVEDDR